MECYKNIEESQKSFLLQSQISDNPCLTTWFSWVHRRVRAKGWVGVAGMLGAPRPSGTLHGLPGPTPPGLPPSTTKGNWASETSVGIICCKHSTQLPRSCEEDGALEKGGFQNLKSTRSPHCPPYQGLKYIHPTVFIYLWEKAPLPRQDPKAPAPTVVGC